MPRIVVTDATFPNLSQERAIAEKFDAEFIEGQCVDPTDVIAAAKGTDVLLVQFAQVTEAAISVLNPNAIVVRYGIGLDNIDLAAAERHGVKVAYVPDYATGEVADHTAAMILAMMRQISSYDRSVREGEWDAVGVGGLITSFREAVAGFIGFGRIGQEVFKRLQPFGFQAVVADPFADKAELGRLGVEHVSIDDVFDRADAITLHAPLDGNTTHIVNRQRLQQMKSTAVLVNTARGGLIDPDALADALEQSWIAGAALDVFEQEPLPSGSRLLGCPNLILSPHAAWYSTRAIETLQHLAADEIDRHLSGQPMRRAVVNQDSNSEVA